MPSTVECTCLKCGRLFECKASDVDRGRGGKYCSRPCYDAARMPSPWRDFLRHASAEPTATGCILWKGSVDPKGYGRINRSYVSDRPILSDLAHRWAWEFARGPVPPGLSVLHRCDRHYLPGDVTYRRCVNPIHLFLGTNTENRADCVRKGRQTRGERCSLARLTEAAVRVIRARAEEGVATKVEIAAEANTSVANVYAILSGRSWKHVT